MTGPGSADWRGLYGYPDLNAFLRHDPETEGLDFEGFPFADPSVSARFVPHRVEGAVVGTLDGDPPDTARASARLRMDVRGAGIETEIGFAVSARGEVAALAILIGALLDVDGFPVSPIFLRD